MNRYHGDSIESTFCVIASPSRPGRRSLLAQCGIGHNTVVVMTAKEFPMLANQNNIQNIRAANHVQHRRQSDSNRGFFGRKGIHFQICSRYSSVNIRRVLEFDR